MLAIIFLFIFLSLVNTNRANSRPTKLTKIVKNVEK